MEWPSGLPEFFVRLLRMEMLDNHILDGSRNAFIDSEVKSIKDFTPQFVTNGGDEKIISVIDSELRLCDEFMMSVAFITLGGLTPLKMTLKELEAKGIRGKVITTDYLTFTDPKALDDLNDLENIQVRMYKTKNKVGFHTKGYMFKSADAYKIIIGSSNLTRDAIMQNHEWNNKIVSTESGSYHQHISAEFSKLWDESVPYADYREEYTALYKKSADTRRQLQKMMKTYQYESLKKVFVPNKMQNAFMENLITLVKDKKQQRALLVSATGTGKTYASAFAVKRLFEELKLKPERILFLSHREQINKQALKTYDNVFEGKIKTGLLSGSYDNKDAHFLFSTMQMMAKENIHRRYAKDEFSVIILDECHRAGAASYQKIIDYFEPTLLLGMSASPERTDNFNVYELFDYNIAYEIRLQDALEEQLLCPFHYFGITEFISHNDDGTATEEDDLSKFRELVSDKRIDYIVENARYYGHCGDKVKGLVFCSSNKEAAELAVKFHDLYGYKTIALSGENTQEERDEAVTMLANDDLKKPYLDYIFTVDIFNEGIDIPEVNQIIMLRPTQSPVVFVQQLGRGLRKYENKEFVVVLDFIGNYDNNYMIPVALSGDSTGNKDNIRRSLSNPPVIGGATIHMDEISRTRIYESIDSVKMNEVKKLVDGYKNLRYKLGRIPSMMDFDNYEAIDLMRIINRFGSYQVFLEEKEKDYLTTYNKLEQGYLKFISQKFADGKRIHELELLSLILDGDANPIENWKKLMRSTYHAVMNDSMLESVLNVLNGIFFAIGASAAEMKKYYFIEKNSQGVYQVAEQFLSLLGRKVFREAVEEIVGFGKHRYERDYSHPYKDTQFNLYKKYTYDDVCRLLGWVKNEVSLNIGGYKYDKFSKTYPVFINYEKDDDIVSTQNYEDRLLNPSSLIAISKSKRTLDSDDVKMALNAAANGVEMDLFIRKNKDDKEAKEFYYMGKIHANGYAKQFEMPGANCTAVEIGYTLETPVEQHLYEYITAS